MNVIGLSSGFSTNLEGYIRITGEQFGTFSSQLAYGFGGKFRVPALLPVIRRLAFWVETTMSDFEEESAIYAPDALRAGMTTTVDSNGVHPTLFLGFAVMSDRAHAMVGGGVSIAAGHNTQIGIEIMHGYWSLNSSQFTASLSYRAFPNVSLQMVPGYLSTAGISTWTISFGVSCSTVDIDFHPFVEPGDKKDEFTLPSIDELERQTQKEKQE